MEIKDDKLHVKRYLDCPECDGNGVIFRNGPLESFGVLGRSPWTCWHQLCWRCKGVCHLGVELK